MKCKCGNEIGKDSKFCEGCGTKVGSNTNNLKDKYNSLNEKEKHKVIGAIIISLLIAFYVCNTMIFSPKAVVKRAFDGVVECDMDKTYKQFENYDEIIGYYDSVSEYKEAIQKQNISCKEKRKDENIGYKILNVYEESKITYVDVILYDDGDEDEETLELVNIGNKFIFFKNWKIID